MTGQQYQIDFVNQQNSTFLESLGDSYSNLTNREWRSRYDTKYVPDAGDLYLVVDAVSFDVSFALTNNQLTWRLTVPDVVGTQIDFTTVDWPFANQTLGASVTFGKDGLNGQIVKSSTSPRALIQLHDNVTSMVPYWNKSSRIPSIDWPESRLVNVSSHSSWKDIIILSSDSWLDKPPLRVAYGLSQRTRNSTAIQISASFMAIVVICNGFKIVAIYFTLKEVSTDHIITQGDAVSSFLREPDCTTVGRCTWDRKRFVQNDLGIYPDQDKFARQWSYSRARNGHDGRSRPVSFLLL
jgi:hypothetical protein